MSYNLAKLTVTKVSLFALTSKKLPRRVDPWE